MADPVQAHYESWVYPTRIDDLTTILSPAWREDLRLMLRLYWPDKPAREELDILVAGCGSMEAAWQAYLLPRSRVTGVDFSRNSLAHEEMLKRKHNLGNLTLRQMRIEDVGALNTTFDLILCRGVLHHLADPVAGLRALGQVLRPDGTMDLMVYGKYGRIGVVMMQEAFRLMGIRPDPAGIKIVKDTLNSLPANHPVRSYMPMARRDMASDEGVADTFLNPRDKPLSCGDCLDLVMEAGLTFQGWQENGMYYPDARLRPQHPLWPHLQQLQGRVLWNTVELLDATIATHWFIACRPERDPATYTIQFEDDAFLDYIPIARVNQVILADPAQRTPMRIVRPPFPALPLDTKQAALFQNVDGVRNVRACVAAAGLPADTAANKQYAQHFFGTLWRAGYALFGKDANPKR